MSSRTRRAWTTCWRLWVSRRHFPCTRSAAPIAGAPKAQSPVQLSPRSRRKLTWEVGCVLLRRPRTRCASIANCRGCAALRGTSGSGRRPGLSSLSADWERVGQWAEPLPLMPSKTPSSAARVGAFGHRLSEARGAPQARSCECRCPPARASSTGQPGSGRLRGHAFLSLLSLARQRKQAAPRPRSGALNKHQANPRNSAKDLMDSRLRGNDTLAPAAMTPVPEPAPHQLARRAQNTKTLNSSSPQE